MIIKTIYHIKCITCIISLLAMQGYAQQTNFTKGVSIAQDTLPPHPSAILEVRSNSKGVLIPKIELAQTEKVTDKIPEPDDGLLVYVTNNDLRKGFWLFSNTHWYHLRKPRTSYPKGAILMYYLKENETIESLFQDGKGVDKMAGWCLCDGRNGTPDLRGHFVMGITDKLYGGDGDIYKEDEHLKYGPSPSSSTNKYPKDKQVLTRDDLPSHPHPYDRDISQENLKYDHFHTVEANKLKHTHDIPVLTAGDKKGDGFHGMRRAAKTQDITMNPAVNENFETGSMIGNESTPLKGIQSLPAGESNPQNIDNRPRFYVLVYIMRTWGDFDYTESSFINDNMFQHNEQEQAEEGN